MSNDPCAIVSIVAIVTAAIGFLDRISIHMSKGRPRKSDFNIFWEQGLLQGVV
jgi:hypothetical protein